ncbi:class I SAM-dependent methyltransferase [Oceaniglobus trochenteri]|uniref:class I SAM-dependent methyltransferase n=1 Tax=Oceaniglobus trochenteri TaxID=2763260 RepID=UPI001CFF5837|nr:class I SAM-dependent methyltransferase [Oceaniglobus trochenteri]
MNRPLRNMTLKNEIELYWSDRAATFDQSVSHRIEDRFGLPEWNAFLCAAFGLGRDGTLVGRRVLDLACGTGEISRVLTGLGAEVTAVDLSETMLALARAKMAGRSWQGHLADAEALHLLDDAAFDHAVTRHLAWTLTDPLAAYREWRRVLKPGGSLLIVDGNWAAPRPPLHRLRHWLADMLDRKSPRDGADRVAHDAIVQRLPYGAGLTRERLERDLRQAGFTHLRPLPVNRLYGAGMRGHALADRLRQTATHRFALVAS